MANNSKEFYDSSLVATRLTRVPSIFGAATEDDGKFSIYSYALNKKAPDDALPENKNKGGIERNGTRYSFPGNISPEGYFYSPFYEVTLKELDDELQTTVTRRINFSPSDSNTSAFTETIDSYNPDAGIIVPKEVTILTIKSPISYDFLLEQPFCIYDVLEETTNFGYLSAFSKQQGGGFLLSIVTEMVTDINDVLSGLKGTNSGGKSRYIISLLTENAPKYAEYIPSSGKLVWRGTKKMSDLSTESPIYNMPFTNGRLYIHRNLNVFVRRQDPHAGYKLFRASKSNPLRRFQVEGDAKLDFDYIQTIIDSMVDAC